MGRNFTHIGRNFVESGHKYDAAGRKYLKPGRTRNNLKNTYRKYTIKIIIPGKNNGCDRSSHSRDPAGTRSTLSNENHRDRVLDRVILGEPWDCSYSILEQRVFFSHTQTVRGIIVVWIGSKIMGDIRKDIYQSLMRLSL